MTARPAESVADGWSVMFAFCGKCWDRKMVWAKGNVGYCLQCRPDWHPPYPEYLERQSDGEACR